MKLTKAQEWMVVYSNIVSKAWTDQAIRASLLLQGNPQEMRSYIKKHFNFEIPQNVDITFHEVQDEAACPNYGEEVFDIFQNPEVPSKHVYALMEAPEDLLVAHGDIHKQAQVTTMCCCCCL
jgi:hypothetical protein